jgi:UDP:flavonoid glycosyltransferase YjiC (YdhE family)
MAKPVLVFAPCAYNLAETTRMTAIARAVRRLPGAPFELQFISDGGEFESLVEDSGFPLERLEPRMTPERIEYAYKLDKGEALGSLMSGDEAIEKIGNELDFLGRVQPAAIVTGSYVTMPITHRILGVPLVWVVQSTWLPGFFTNGAGMTDGIRFRPAKRVADMVIHRLIDLWMKVGLLRPLNKAARHYGVAPITNIFDYWRGDLTLVAEPPDFTGADLPDGYAFIGPLIAREQFPVPPEVTGIPRDKPLVYFAMGSSGTPRIVARIIESFEGKPYRVIAPVRSLLDRVPGVRIPDNVVVTGWLPALEANRLADISVIHGGIGTVMTAGYAGRPIVGVGMQPEQTANLAAVERKGFAIRVPKSTDPSARIHAAISSLLNNSEARQRAEEFARSLESWDGPSRAAEVIASTFAPGQRASPRQ